MSGDEGLMRGGQGEDDGFDEGDEETNGLRARRLGIGGRGEVEGQSLTRRWRRRRSARDDNGDDEDARARRAGTMEVSARRAVEDEERRAAV